MFITSVLKTQWRIQGRGPGGLPPYIKTKLRRKKVSRPPPSQLNPPPPPTPTPHPFLSQSGSATETDEALRLARL